MKYLYFDTKWIYRINDGRMALCDGINMIRQRFIESCSMRLNDQVESVFVLKKIICR